MTPFLDYSYLQIGFGMTFYWELTWLLSESEIDSLERNQELQYNMTLNTSVCCWYSVLLDNTITIKIELKYKNMHAWYDY